MRAVFRHAAALQLRYDPTRAGVAPKAQRVGAWALGALARDRDGVEVPYDSPEAVAFCSVGATNRAEIDLGVAIDDYHGLPLSDSMQSPLGLIKMWARTIEAALSGSGQKPNDPGQPAPMSGAPECA